MNTDLFLNVIILCSIFSVFFIGINWILSVKLFPTFKQRSKPIDVSEVYETLNVIISMEISVLERDIFSEFGNVLDSQSFENYYHYLTRKCLNDISPTFFYRASFIITEEAIADFVCKSISNYLKTRIASGTVEEK